MTNVIPTTILDQFIIEKTPGAFLEDATKTAIDHAGNLVLPIATLQTVEEHTENAEITTNGYVPGKLTISHSEYAYNTGYSAMGVRIAAGNLETIVTNTLMASMLKKMDGICLDAVAVYPIPMTPTPLNLRQAPPYVRRYGEVSRNVRPDSLTMLSGMFLVLLISTGCLV